MRPLGTAEALSSILQKWPYESAGKVKWEKKALIAIVNCAQIIMQKGNQHFVHTKHYGIVATITFVKYNIKYTYLSWLSVLFSKVKS